MKMLATPQVISPKNMVNRNPQFNVCLTEQTPREKYRTGGLE